jgi:hypothetical protein
MNPQSGKTEFFESVFAQTNEQKHGRDITTPRSVVKAWDPEIFAREQMRRLVRHVFFSSPEKPIRQVVLAGIEPETDLRPICRSVGEELARETAATIALVGSYPQIFSVDNLGQEEPAPSQTTALPAIRLQNNLWMVPSLAAGEITSTAQLISRLCDLRRNFEYSIAAGPSAGESHESIALAQMADGVILILSAQHTRRAAARKVKQMLDAARVRILGSILCDRIFPIPESLYRRL